MANTIIRMWHRWRITALEIELMSKKKECAMIELAERAYRSSYYADWLIEAACQQIKIAGKLEYHKSMVKDDSAKKE